MNIGDVRDTDTTLMWLLEMLAAAYPASE